MPKDKEPPTFDPEEIQSQDDSFEEIEAEGEPPELGEFVKFQQLGDSLEGVLKERRQFRSQFKGKEQTVYDIETPDGLFTVTGNWDLNNKMDKVRTGSFLRITYVGDKPMENRPDFTPMRIFKVEVSRSKTGHPHGGVMRKSPLKTNPNWRR